jgi:DNA-binding NtrC family response regulator
MEREEILRGKRILVVDDEQDVLDTATGELSSCLVVTASDFDTARRLIDSEQFDMVILDIMGVNGFALLELCRKAGQPAFMLTAHAIDRESIEQAMKLGAVSFLPKDELFRLSDHLAEILLCVEAGGTHWARLFEKLGRVFEERLGVSWEDLEKTPPYPPSTY